METDTPKHWYVIYTKSRSEKKVAERLLVRGFTVYCPVRKEIKIWSDRKKKVEVPIFSSYVFVEITEHDRYKVLEVPGVVNFVFWLGQPAKVRENEIEAIREFLSDYPIAQAREFDLEKGQKVEVQTGQLKQQKGIIREIRNKTVILQLEGLGFELFAEVDKRYVG